MHLTLFFDVNEMLMVHWVNKSTASLLWNENSNFFWMKVSTKIHKLHSQQQQCMFRILCCLWNLEIYQVFGCDNIFSKKIVMPWISTAPSFTGVFIALLHLSVNTHMDLGLENLHPGCLGMLKDLVFISDLLSYLGFVCMLLMDMPAMNARNHLSRESRDDGKRWRQWKHRAWFL